MSPIRLPSPNDQFVIKPSNLCQEAFAEFGDVVENPAPSLVPSPHLKELPSGAVLGNQGSALVYGDITRFKNLYDSAPSQVRSKTAVRMFVCAPRPLLRVQDNNSLEGSLRLTILERHPYTSQTFIPLGLSAAEVNETRYLVIVAPTLPQSLADESLPVPSGKDLPGRGLPDLANIQAFIAKGSQAVTYGPGTWHAPMIVVGKKPVSFVVAQFLNGVGLEDCQEADWEAANGKGITVAVPKNAWSEGLWTSKL